MFTSFIAAMDSSLLQGDGAGKKQKKRTRKAF